MFPWSMQWSRLTSLGGVGLLAGVALLTAGCGGTGTVSGKISYNGLALGGGRVTFMNADGKGSKSAPIQPDGSYMIEVPSGPAKIAVETQSVKPVPGKGHPVMPKPPPGKEPAGYDPKMYEGGPSKDEKYVPIPATYGDIEQSGLTYTVTRGSQEHDIKLP